MGSYAGTTRSKSPVPGLKQAAGLRKDLWGRSWRSLVPSLPMHPQILTTFPQRQDETQKQAPHGGGCPGRAVSWEPSVPAGL